MKNQNLDFALFVLAAVLSLCLLFGGQAEAGAKLAEMVVGWYVGLHAGF